MNECSLFLWVWNYKDVYLFINIINMFTAIANISIIMLINNKLCYNNPYISLKLKYF